MIFFKVGLLACAFYVTLTIFLEAGIWALAHTKGFMIYFAGRNWFWSMGLRLGLIFGGLWLVSFAAAWCIVFQGLKAKLPL